MGIVRRVGPKSIAWHAVARQGDACRWAARLAESRFAAAPPVNTGFAEAIARCEAERHRERQRRAIAAEDRNRDRSSRRTPQLRRVTLWQKGRDHPELTDPAMRTACLLDARDPLHELGDRLDHRGRRWRHVECRTSSRQSLRVGESKP